MWANLFLLLPLLASVVVAECEFDRQVYEDGSYISNACLILVCIDTTWEATGDVDRTCEKCSLHNDPHFVNFDNCYFDFHGTCNYSIAIDDDFGVYGDFKQCNTLASCINIISFKDGPNTVITLDKDDLDTILVNGDVFAVDNVVRNVESSGPTTHGALAWKHDSYCIRVLGTQGIALSFCGWALYVWASNDIVDNLNGLCTSDHGFDCDGAYGPLDASYEDIHDWGQSHEVSGSDNCTISSTFTGGTRPQRQKRALPGLPVWCDPVTEATFRAMCEAALTGASYHGNTASSAMLNLYVGFCTADLCAMAYAGASSTDFDDWMDILAIMMVRTIETSVRVIDPASNPFDEEEEEGDHGQGQMPIGGFVLQVMQNVG